MENLSRPMSMHRYLIFKNLQISRAEKAPCAAAGAAGRHCNFALNGQKKRPKLTLGVAFRVICKNNFGSRFAMGPLRRNRAG